MKKEEKSFEDSLLDQAESLQTISSAISNFP